MTDNSPKTFTAFSAWLPVACLALSAAAFSLDAPARLARAVHRSSASPRLSDEIVMRDEHVLFPMPVIVRSRASYLPRFVRDAHMILGRQLAAIR